MFSLLLCCAAPRQSPVQQLNSISLGSTIPRYELSLPSSTGICAGTCRDFALFLACLSCLFAFRIHSGLHGQWHSAENLVFQTSQPCTLKKKPESRTALLQVALLLSGQSMCVAGVFLKAWLYGLLFNF